MSGVSHEHMVVIGKYNMYKEEHTVARLAYRHGDRSKSHCFLLK